MIQFVTGLPGAGKGVYLMTLIRETLLETEDYVVTNLPVIPWKLSGFLSKRYKWEGDINERLRVISREEVREFHRYRSPEVVLPYSSDAERQERKKVEKTELIAWLDATYANAPKGVSYYIDEAHIHYDSREWTETGRSLTWYVSQHRHMHDNVVFASQMPEQVERRLRILAQSRWDVRNTSLEKFGAFRKPKGFLVSGYYKCPENIAQAHPFERYRFQLDLGLVNCYETTGAIGRKGEGRPEKQAKVKGLPFWMLPAGIAAVFVVGLGAFWSFPSFLASAVIGEMEPTRKMVERAPAEPVVHPIRATKNLVPAEPEAVQETLARCIGMVGNGEDWRVAIQYASGRVQWFGSASGLTEVQPDRVRVNGAWYAFERKW